VNVNIGTSGAEIGGAFGGEKDTGRRHVIELDKSLLFIQIPWTKSGFETFFTYTDLVFLLKMFFRFMVYLIL
jgi:hypothetical protein